jgi:hypothetical protein
LRRDQVLPFFARLQPCARKGFGKARTAQANQIRGLLAEFGLVTTRNSRSHHACGWASRQGSRSRRPHS